MRGYLKFFLFCLLFVLCSLVRKKIRIILFEKILNSINKSKCLDVFRIKFGFF